MSEMTTPALTTKRRALGQIAFCLGCCCGRVDRGFPAVPVEQLKAAWKAEKLNAAVQLTISGCLGPCDLPNVALVLTPTGTQWLGRLADSDFDEVLSWVRTCKAAGELQPLPPALAAKSFERFPA
jgi:hypothetical protein